MYICTRVNLQDMYFEHVNAQNKILSVNWFPCSFTRIRQYVKQFNKARAF